MSYKLCSQRYEEIKEEVVTLLKEYVIQCTPVSGFELAILMGITLIPYSSLSSEQKKKAMIVSQDGFFTVYGFGKEVIFYNDEQDYRRVNWTILHEIGHCVLGHIEHDDEAEAEANFFAKYAAAPPVLIHKIYPKSPMVIADKFGLSYEAACNAFSYYQKWLRYGSNEYTPYEITLLNLFQVG